MMEWKTIDKCPLSLFRDPFLSLKTIGTLTKFHKLLCLSVSSSRMEILILSSGGYYEA